MVGCEMMAVGTLNKVDEPLMQFTGFLDNEGVEIYFGDIVDFNFIDPNDPSQDWNGTALIVKTMGHGVGLMFDYVREGDEQLVYAVDDGGVIEDLWIDPDMWTLQVVGNQFANPELLNNKDNG